MFFDEPWLLKQKKKTTENAGATNVWKCGNAAMLGNAGTTLAHMVYGDVERGGRVEAFMTS